MSFQQFVKGSSVVAAIPTLVYLGAAQRKNRIKLLRTNPEILLSFLSIPYESIVVGVLILYGIAYASLPRDTDKMSNN